MSRGGGNWERGRKASPRAEAMVVGGRKKVFLMRCEVMVGDVEKPFPMNREALLVLVERVKGGGG